MQSVHVVVDSTAGDADAGEELQHDLPHRQEQHELQSLLTVLQTPVGASRSAVVDPGKLGESGGDPVVGGPVSTVHEEPSDGYREKCRLGGGGDVSAEGSEGLNSLDSTFTSRSAGQTPDGEPPRAQRDVTTACVSQVQWVLLTSVSSVCVTCVCVCVCVCVGVCAYVWVWVRVDVCASGCHN